MSIAASREPRLSKPGPSIADPSNTAAPATASHRAAAAAAEAERKIRAEISAQRAAEGSPFITPPPDTPISTSDKQSLSPIQEDEDNLGKLDNLRDNLARKSTKSKQALTRNGGQSYCYIYLIFLRLFFFEDELDNDGIDKLDNLRARKSLKSKQAPSHVNTGQSYCHIYLIYLIHSLLKMKLSMMGCILTSKSKKYLAQVKTKRKTRILPSTSNISSQMYHVLREIRKLRPG
jgi:hypothetical protein